MGRIHIWRNLNLGSQGCHFESSIARPPLDGNCFVLYKSTFINDESSVSNLGLKSPHEFWIAIFKSLWGLLFSWWSNLVWGISTIRVVIFDKGELLLFSSVKGGSLLFIQSISRTNAKMLLLLLLFFPKWSAVQNPKNWWFMLLKLVWSPLDFDLLVKWLYICNNWICIFFFQIEENTTSYLGRM